MGRCILLVQDPQLFFFSPQLWPFLMNSLLQCCQNFQIVSLVYSLIHWNSFSHHDAIDVEKTISMALNFDFDILAFFILGNAGVFQCMDYCLVSTSYWNFMVSSQVIMFSINSSSSSNLIRKSEQVC